MKPFIVVTPSYSANSNGICTLHKICHTINRIGGSARLAYLHCGNIVLHDSTWSNPKLDTPSLLESEKHLIDECYVVYPEIITGNPLGGKMIVRWMGNKEGYCCDGRKMNAGANDFFVAHSLAVKKDAHCVLFNSEINPAFHCNDSFPFSQRKMDVTYIGKGNLYGEVKIIKDSVYIARDWPISQEQLAIMLRNTRVFYTWDSWTATNIEAVLCGALPFFMRYDPWTESDLDNSELGRIPRCDPQHPNMNSGVFESERLAMIEKMNALERSWDARVGEFMGKVERHFA